MEAEADAGAAAGGGGMGGGMGGMGGGQMMGGGMGGMGGGMMGGMGGGMGGMGMGGGMMGGGGGGFFSIPPEKTVQVPLTTVCLEHGKAEPRTKMTYKLVKLEEYTSDPALQGFWRWSAAASSRMTKPLRKPRLGISQIK